MAEQYERHALADDCRKRMDALHQSLDASGRQTRLAEIEKVMSRPDFWDDQEAALRVVEEMKSVKSVLDPLLSIDARLSDAIGLLDLAEEENDQETAVEAEKELRALSGEIDKLEILALLSGAHDREPCFFSIHTGAGGADACEWAEMLLRMYTRFFERKGWKVEQLNLLPGEESGIRGADLRVTGSYAYGYLKGERGVHRLVRISPFSGRRETSFAAVDVVPDFQRDIQIEVEEKDLRVDTFRSSGKGGQHVNKTDSAVRLTHLPTGIVVSVQNERSQHRNRDVAMKILKSRLLQRAEAEREAAADARNAEKMENAWGSQIRNYVMHPYQLVKDVRTEFEKGDIQKILDGDIDEFIDAYLKWSIRQSA